MTRWRTSLVALACLPLGLAPRAMADDARQPYEWVRTLEAVQEQIGQGSKAAYDYLPKLIAEIAVETEKISPETLRDPRNVRAVLAYTLGGGDGRVARKLLGLGALSPVDEKVARGALAYAEGKYADAAEHFDEIDSRALDPSIAGRVALIQSILVYKSDPKKAIQYLNFARLLSAGTLVEEAALRRQVVLEAGVKDQDRFETLADQYFRKYKSSIYAGYFKEQFSIAAAGLDYGTDKVRLDRLKRIVENLDDRDQAALYLMLAEKAVFVGNLPLTTFAAKSSEQLTAPESVQRKRAQLYRASAAVANDKPEEAVALLRDVTPSQLSAVDAGLLWAALSVAGEIMRAPEPKPEVVAAAPAVATHVEADPHSAATHGAETKDSAAAANPDPEDKIAEDPLVESAKKAMAQADALLSGKRK